MRNIEFKSELRNIDLARAICYVVNAHRVGVLLQTDEYLIVPEGRLKRRMERANRINARAAVILGEAELAAGVAQLRDLDAGTQESITLADIPARLK